MKTIILGITSGIAAYKSLELITLLKKQEYAVVAVMTKHATTMLSLQEVEKATGHQVYTELFEKDFNYKDTLEKRHVDHIDLVGKADIMVIVPATANSIAKLAHGIADDFLTTTALAMTKPILICPAMNVHMWENTIVQENISKLKQHGYLVLHPAKGMLACGYEGIGRLPEIAVINDTILEILKKNESLKGKKIIVTAGGTREPIDDVRYIANRSSGKMGTAIAEVCSQRGADVLLLRAKQSVKPNSSILEETFMTAEELFSLIKKYISRYDYIYHTAAVSDFTVINKQQGKISSNKSISLELKPQIKIINEIKKLNPTIKLIACKAEFGLTENELLEKARTKLKQSKADVIIANDVSKQDRGFESDMNAVITINRHGVVKKFPHSTKKHIAEQLVDMLELSE